MQTVRGHVYRIGLATSSSISDPSWLAGPLAVTFPVDVMSVDAAPPGAVAVVRWAGDPEDLLPGAVVTTHVPGSPSLGLEPIVTVASVDDLGPAAAPLSTGPGPFWNLAFAAALLVGVALLVRRIRPAREAV